MKILDISKFKKEVSYEIPLVENKVRAGFPSPAEDYIDKKIDLNKELIRHPSATFFVKVSGDSMQGAGIHTGDMLIVDRALNPKKGSIIVALLETEFTVKRFIKEKNMIKLVAENPAYETIEITEETEFEVWGVVTNVIHPV